MAPIIGRAQWGARQPKKTPQHVGPAKRVYFVVHHSGAPSTQSVRAIQDWCMDGRSFNDIDYNHLVRATTGEIYEGRGWDVVGAHTTNYNTNGVGVCVIGNDEISDSAKTSVRWLYDQYVKRCGHDLKVRGHRDLATTGTTCPGDRIYAWVKAGMPAPGTQPEEDDVTKAEFTTWMNDWAESDKGRDLLARAVFGHDPGRNDRGQTGPAVPDPGAPEFNAKDPKTYGPGVGTIGLGTAVSAILDKAGKLQGAVTDQGRTLAAIAGRDMVDEPQIIAGLLAGVNPTIIAQAIPKDLAKQVADLLATRLAA